ncbi:MAG: SulP family inorganic anion transporter [Candidatus Omnitrophota bacterium]|nr:SulP family inorganic anion transporter [Candidatus Omnitrophota bacterium]
MLRPKLIDTLKNYSLKQFQHDLSAGIVVGIVALPLAIAFAIASGVTPEKGIITAIIAGFIISALGGSRVQIGGPTGAFVVIVYEIIQRYGMDGLVVATVMAGVMLVLFGFARFGAVIKLIPYPVIIGFTSGIALIIFSSQINDLLGLGLTAIPSGFIEKWHLFLLNISKTNFSSLCVSAGTIFAILVIQRKSRKIPGSFIAIIFTTLIVQLFHLPVETIGDRFGSINGSFSLPEFPTINIKLLESLSRPAFTIAVLAGIESLLSAVVADGMIGGKHRSNMELIAQGIANIVVPFFGGIPATGAIARTATNVYNGGRTPVAGIIHAITLAIIFIFFGKYAVLIPLATLAGILVIIAYRMGEWRSFSMVLQGPKSDALVLLIVFLLTVMFDLTIAIEIGILLAAFLFIRRIVNSNIINQMQGVYVDEEERDDPDALSKKIIPQGVEVYEINGPFFFGVASTFIETMNNIEKEPLIRILRMRHALSIDATAMNALRRVVNESRKRKILIILSGLNSDIYNKIERSGLVKLIGSENILPNISGALERAEKFLSERQHK